MNAHPGYRSVLATVLAALVLTLLPAPVLAAPPANDEISRARILQGIPTRVTQDTSEATFDPDTDAAVGCVFGSSVWYRFRPRRTVTARVVTIGSDYDTVLAVFRGPRTSLRRVACNDDAVGLSSAVQVRFLAGRTYWFAVSACCSPESVGGTVVLTTYRPRPFRVLAEVGRASAGDVSGRAFLRGTVRCTNPGIAGVTASISQRVGDFVARGRATVDASAPCWATQTWTMAVDSETAVAFRPGRAALTLQRSGSDGFEFFNASATSIITLVESPNRSAKSTS